MKCYGIVNLTRDPELRHTQGGTAIANLGIAHNRKFVSRSGEKKEETTFLTAKAFGKQAETLAQHLKKGSKLFVEGTLKQETWESDGQKKSAVVVLIDRFEFAGSKPADSSAPAKLQTRQASHQPPQQPEPADSDVPF